MELLKSYYIQRRDERGSVMWTSDAMTISQAKEYVQMLNVVKPGRHFIVRTYEG